MDKDKPVTRSKRKAETSPSPSNQSKKSVLKKPAPVIPRERIHQYLTRSGSKPAEKSANCNTSKTKNSLKQQNLDSFVRKSGRDNEFNPIKHTSQQQMKDEEKKTVESSTKNIIKERSKRNATSKKSVRVQSKKETTDTAMKSAKGKTKKDKDLNSLYHSPLSKLYKQVPKVEDILRSLEEEKRFDQMKKLIEQSSAKFLSNLETKKVNQSERNKRKKTWNCKHLTLKDLEKRFNKDHEFLDNIFHGKVYSERHEKFKEETFVNTNCPENDLRLNETSSAFTVEQLIYIISLFRAKYDNGNIYKFTDYYFKVLLPEFCLKIFMDCFRTMKTKDKAIQYLKSLPLPNNFGLT